MEELLKRIREYTLAFQEEQKAWVKSHNENITVGEQKDLNKVWSKLYDLKEKSGENLLEYLENNYEKITGEPL